MNNNNRIKVPIRWRLGWIAGTVRDGVSVSFHSVSLRHVMMVLDRFRLLLHAMIEASTIVSNSSLSVFVKGCTYRMLLQTAAPYVQSPFVVVVGLI
jgi:hypothetical protein